MSQAGAQPTAMPRTQATPKPTPSSERSSNDQADRLRRAMGDAAPTAERPAAGPGTETAAEQASDRNGTAVATADTQGPQHRAGRDGFGDASIQRVTDAETEAKVIVPSNKRELFEELQKNYREVVTLVRKVDGHLDEQSARSERLLEIAKRFDESLPLLERMAETPEKLDALREELAKIAADASGRSDKQVARVEQAVTKVVEGVAAQHKDQHRLVAVMAEFRETVGELSTTNTESAKAVQTLGEGVTKRDEAMLQHMATVQKRMTFGLVVISLIGITALIVALVG